MYPGRLLPRRPLSSSRRPAIDLPLILIGLRCCSPTVPTPPSIPELTDLFSLPPVGLTLERVHYLSTDSRFCHCSASCLLFL